jgi:predicted DNA-binding ribbon-helix-helix protein
MSGYIQPKRTWAGKRRVSLRLEPEYWDALNEVAARRGLATWTVLEQIEQKRGRKQFSSAVRVELLQAYRSAPA